MTASVAAATASSSAWSSSSGPGPRAVVVDATASSVSAGDDAHPAPAGSTIGSWICSPRRRRRRAHALESPTLGREVDAGRSRPASSLDLGARRGDDPASRGRGRRIIARPSRRPDASPARPPPPTERRSRSTCGPSPGCPGRCTTSPTRSSRSRSSRTRSACGWCDPEQFGERDGSSCSQPSRRGQRRHQRAGVADPRRLSDRGGRRLPFLLLFTAAVHRPDVRHRDVAPLVGLILFIVANFAYQAALIYYDASLKLV